MSDRQSFAMCICGSPLVSTFHWAKHEWYCLDCGRIATYFGCRAAPWSEELQAKADAYGVEWSEHAAALITPRSWLGSCALCDDRNDSHDQHATEAEWQAHRDAVQWLVERKVA